MATQFDKVTVDLWRSLGLGVPQPIDGILSLQISEQVVHVVEQPQGSLVMFGSLERIADHEIDQILCENLFLDDPLQPVGARSSADDVWVFWNRQSLDHCEISNMQHQLEVLSAKLERLSQG
ncbi:CesT family type III secretion system chaperone [Pandoraea fibrosis]|uniref:YopE regulator n=1 Tax=Pandoraea fibrosis TaxID=1891094 RepID=A0A5E4SRP4_9BURK|nr:CesT family type III secretion system chaperone [Pandoraea fibrosis]VVD76509.1 YopE regulator [Pandoraea fibrosis]